MTSAIEDLSSLPGSTVNDQAGRDIGTIREIYAYGDGGEPMWVTIDAQLGGIGQQRTVFVPLARLKQEQGQLSVPYSLDHIRQAPQVERAEELSEGDDRRLRDHYGIDRADQELRSDHDSYATLVPEEAGAPARAVDPDQVETPDADKRDDETRERVEDPGPRETRHVTFGEGDSGDADGHADAEH